MQWDVKWIVKLIVHCAQCEVVEKLNQELLSSLKVLPQSQASSRLYKIALKRNNFSRFTISKFFMAFDKHFCVNKEMASINLYKEIHSVLTKNLEESP